MDYIRTVSMAGPSALQDRHLQPSTLEHRQHPGQLGLHRGSPGAIRRIALNPTAHEGSSAVAARTRRLAARDAARLPHRSPDPRVAPAEALLDRRQTRPHPGHLGFPTLEIPA